MLVSETGQSRNGQSRTHAGQRDWSIKDLLEGEAAVVKRLVVVVRVDVPPDVRHVPPRPPPLPLCVRSPPSVSETQGETEGDTVPCPSSSSSTPSVRETPSLCE